MFSSSVPWSPGSRDISKTALSPETRAVAVLANPAVDVAMVGARNPHQIKQTAPAADEYHTPETLGKVEQVIRDVVPMGESSLEGVYGPADGEPN